MSVCVCVCVVRMEETTPCDGVIRPRFHVSPVPCDLTPSTTFDCNFEEEDFSWIPRRIAADIVASSAPDLPSVSQRQIRKCAGQWCSDDEDIGTDRENVDLEMKGDNVSVPNTPTTPTENKQKTQSEKTLSDLLHLHGRPSTVSTKESQKKKVMRKDQFGIATKVALLLESVIADINKLHGLDKYPLSIRNILSCMQEGKQILDDCKKVQRSEVMAQAQLDLVDGAGRAHTSAMLGSMAKANKKGKMKTKDLSELTGKSESWIRACRLQVERSGLGALGDTNKTGYRKAHMLCPTRLDRSHGECTDKDCRLLHDCQCCKDGSVHSASVCPKWNATKALRADKARLKRITKLVRRTCEEAEVFSTQLWMQEENPARSGDQKIICWMVKGRFDFFHENYRSNHFSSHNNTY